MDQVQKPSNFDLFILALSVFSLVNIVWLFVPLPEPIFRVVLIVDTVCTIAFLTDFFLRLRRAPARSTYFLRQKGWLDLIGSFPFPVMRLARGFRMLRTYRRLRRDGGEAVLRRMVADRAGSALLFAVFLTILVLQYASMAILWAESNHTDANILTASDAAWWSFVTITTVGYGDRYPTTDWGRLVGVLLLSTGVCLFAVITGFIANSFLAPGRASAKEEAARRAALDIGLRQLDELTERLCPATPAPTPLAEAETQLRSSPDRQEAMQ
jgi:voltage-gated potassium channel